MVWVRVDDHFDEHEKIVGVGPLGLALYVAGLCFCNRNLTDGFIPAPKARSLMDWHGIGLFEPKGLGGPLHGADGETVAGWLVAAGLWEEVDGGYQVHDYGEYQPSREQVVAERKAAAERQRKWKDERLRRRRGEGNGVTNGGSNGVTNDKVTPAPFPTPTPSGVRGRGGARAPEGAAPAQSRIAAALTTACRVGVQEARAREAINAHGVEAVERANVAGLKPPIRADAVSAWFDALKS